MKIREILELMNTEDIWSDDDIDRMAVEVEEELKKTSLPEPKNIPEMPKAKPPKAGGQKFDGQGDDDHSVKPRWELLPIEGVEEIVKVLTDAVTSGKYEEWSWKGVTPRSRYLGSAFRHIKDWMIGVKTDKDSGLPVLAHACCCFLFLMHFDREKSKKTVK